MRKSSFFFSLALLFLGFAASAAPSFQSTPHNSNSPIDIQAEKFENLPDDWVAASGNVLIRQSDAQVTADRIRVNRKTGEVIAEGNVILVREGQSATRADRIVYNYLTGEGLTSSIDVQSQDYRIIANESRRDSHGSFFLSDALVTTCTNDPSCLHYAITAGEAEFFPGQYVQLHHAKVRFFDVPIFYYPLFQRSLVDHFGWTFLPGYESDWGGYLLTTYRAELFDLGGEFHDSIGSRTHFDFRSERGWALGEDITWKFGDAFDGGSRGMIGFYGIADDDPMNEDFDRYSNRDIVEENRYRITLRHDTFFSPANYLTIRSSFFSDSYVLEDFYEEEYKDYIQPESYARFYHNGEFVSWGLGVDQRANDFYQTVNRLPEATFDTSLLELGSSGFYYENENSAGFLEYAFADYDRRDLTNYVNTAELDYDSFRFDSRHEINRPFKAFGFLSIVPRAAYRATYYSKTKEASVSESFDPVTSNLVSQTSYSEGGAQLRNLLEFGTEISFKAYGLFESLDDPRIVYRHTVEPYANWTYIPEPNLRPDCIYQFDNIDRLDMDHYVRAGVRQMLHRRNADRRISKNFELDLFLIYSLNDENEEKGVKSYGADLEWAVAKDIRIESNASYDAIENEFDYIDFWVSLWQGERWEAAGECYYIPDDTSLFKGDLRCNLSEHWAVGTYARYDAEESRCEQISGYLQWNLDCLSFRFKTDFVPAYERDDGTEREAKLRFSLFAWVRQFTPPRYEQKLRDKYWDD